MLNRTLLSRIPRNVWTTAVRQHGHDNGGIPGENLPFKLGNRFRMTATFIVFLGSGVATPFLMVRHQLLKQKA